MTLNRLYDLAIDKPVIVVGAKRVVVLGMVGVIGRGGLDSAAFALRLVVRVALGKGSNGSHALDGSDRPTVRQLLAFPFPIADLVHESLLKTC